MMPVGEGQVELGNAAAGDCVRLWLLHGTLEFAAEELHHEAIDGVTEQNDATTPEPAEVTIILHRCESVDLGLAISINSLLSTSAFGNSFREPLPRCRRVLGVVRLRFRRVEDDLAGWGVDSIIGGGSIKKVVRERNPLCLFVLVGAVYISRDIEVTRLTIRVLTVVY